MTSNDYYTTEMLHEIWSPDWHDGMFRQGLWRSGGGGGGGSEQDNENGDGEAENENENGLLDPVPHTYQNYHPYACHACKRGALTGTKLYVCQGCKVIRYCSPEHQKADWKFHKKWCQAFAQLTVPMDRYGSRQEWEKASMPITGELLQLTPLDLHSVEMHIAIMQPRCRKCFRSEASLTAAKDEDTKIVVCPRCGGVGICEACVAQEDKSLDDPSLFHFDSDDPVGECNGHLLSLCCMGLIVEQGNPLGLPCSTDAEEYWNPKDWIEYFRVKRDDYELDSRMLEMAPIPAFLTDAHSTILTVQHVLGLEAVAAVTDTPPDQRRQMIIHICGASVTDTSMPGRYVELTRLNPQLEVAELHLIGPNMSAELNEPFVQALEEENIRPECTVSVQCHEGLYHEIAPQLEDAPSIVICTNAGLSDRNYVEQWEPTIRYILQQDTDTCLLLTGYNHEEIVDDAAMLQEWGAQIVVPPTPNPFRSLRPYLDPTRSPRDLIYTNASFVVAKGRGGGEMGGPSATTT